jgi:hypothetical protein
MAELLDHDPTRGSRSCVTSNPAPRSRLEQLKALGELREAGVLTEVEFAEKKAELLARI